jgi:hypothetical protein
VRAESVREHHERAREFAEEARKHAEEARHVAETARALARELEVSMNRQQRDFDRGSETPR